MTIKDYPSVHVLEIEDQMTGEEVVNKILKIVEKKEKEEKKK